jgi:glycosyltransferase involved in cell wall biosynthesis
MKTVLIFEPRAGGHRANYIRWLADAVKENPPAGFHFIFVTDPGIEVPAAAPISSHKISPELAQKLASSGSAWRLRTLLREIFDTCMAEHAPDHALILELTQLELSFALCGTPRPVSAILFVQYPELSRGLKFFLKDWKTSLLLHRSPVKNLFLLNGEESCRWLTTRFGARARFIPLPDSAPEAEPETGFVMRDAYAIAPARRVFLFFGAISPRKGADVLIDALHLLPPEAAAQSAFIFCGQPESGYRQIFEALILRLRAARPDIQLNVEHSFVSDQRMRALFEQSDVVLMPYTRPEYSSGVLALAAKARTPVIGPAGGLLGRLIRQNGLGAVCAIHPEAVAKSIADAVRSLPAVDDVRCSAFVKRSRPKVFASVILDAIRGDV